MSGSVWALKTHTPVFHAYPLSHLPGPSDLVAIISLNIFHPRWFACMDMEHVDIEAYLFSIFGNNTFSRALRFVPGMPGASVVPPGLLRMLVGLPLMLTPLCWSLGSVLSLLSPSRSCLSHRRKCRSNSMCCSPPMSSSPSTKPSWAPSSGPASWWTRPTDSRTTSPR